LTKKNFYGIIDIREKGDGLMANYSELMCEAIDLIVK
jgi:hypothetical protein